MQGINGDAESDVNPWLIIGFLGAMAFASGAGWHAHSVYDKAEERDRLAAALVSIQQDQNEARQISQGLQEAVAGLRPQFTTIRNEVQREIIEKPVYRDANCALPDDGRMRLDAAIRAANAAGRLDPIVPGPADAVREPTR